MRTLIAALICTMFCAEAFSQAAPAPAGKEQSPTGGKTQDNKDRDPDENRPDIPKMEHGDTVIFQSRTPMMAKSGAREGKPVIAPPRSRFTYIGTDENGTIYLKSKNRIACKAPFSWTPEWLLNVVGSSDEDGFCTFNNTNPEQVHKNESYTIDKITFRYADYVYHGWTSGILVVPYKYVLANHDLAKGNFTLGPYLGYKTTFFSTESTIALSAGIANVAVPTIENGVATNTMKPGISVAIGFLFNVKGVSAGFLAGVDQLGQNSQYQNNGKAWIGLFVGGGFNTK